VRRPLALSETVGQTRKNRSGEIPIAVQRGTSASENTAGPGHITAQSGEQRRVDLVLPTIDSRVTPWHSR
jgi:hypothetical protein